jgi:hypothetical protein
VECQFFENIWLYLRMYQCRCVYWNTDTADTNIDFTSHTKILTLITLTHWNSDIPTRIKVRSIISTVCIYLISISVWSAPVFQYLWWKQCQYFSVIGDARFSTSVFSGIGVSFISPQYADTDTSMSISYIYYLFHDWRPCLIELTSFWTFSYFFRHNIGKIGETSNI